MNINYRRLFNLVCTHNYYAASGKSGLSLHPTAETRRRLRDARMLFRPVSNGFTILYRAQDDEVTPVVALEELRLIFELNLEHPSTFFTVTELAGNASDSDGGSTKKERASGFIYIRNDPSEASADPDQPEVMQHEVIDRLSPSLFTSEFTLTDSPDEVLFHVYDRSGTRVAAGYDPAGDPLPAELVKDDDGVYRRQVDLRGQSSGKYTLVVRNREETEILREEKLYVDDDLAGRAVPGIVEITYEAGSGCLFGEIEEYEVRFRRKETVWTYYIVNKYGKTTLSEEFLIEDGSPEVVNLYSAVNFAVDGDVPHASVRVNGMDTMIFRSEEPIPFYDIPKPAVRLKKSASNVLVKNLPNPSHQAGVKESDEGPEAEIYVFI